MNPDDVYIHRTSPRTLRDDLDTVLSQALSNLFETEKSTLIKINGNYDRYYPGSNTSKWFLDALLLALKDRNFKKLSVIEGDLPLFKATKMIQNTGLKDILKRYKVDFIPYEYLPRDKLEVPILLHDAQLINVPVFHSHGLAVISCATKNLFGLLPKHRRIYHPILSEKLLEIVQRLKMFTIVDGTVGLDGESTRRGNPRRLDLILAGWNSLTIDTVAARVMGFSPSEIPLLKLAMDRNLFSDTFDIWGDFSWENLPEHNFTFQLSKIRKLNIFLRGDKAPRKIRSIYRIKFIDWLENQLRHIFHEYNYYRKRRSLFSGTWMEYEHSMRADN